MYKSVPRNEIAEALVHIRALFRQIKPTNEHEFRVFERREATIRDLLSNLKRTGEHPTLKTLLDIADTCAMTLDGAHRLFGYRLDGMQELDHTLNAGRTRLIEAYSFARDRWIDLPLELHPMAAFDANAELKHLVSRWQFEVPIGAVSEEGWHRPGAFYVHVGTEDSRGSSIPAGAIALVEPVERSEEQRPNPRNIYLLQFGNGYRCSHCVVTPGKLQPFSTRRAYLGREQFIYPGDVRIVGRVRMFALSLPMPEYSSLDAMPQAGGHAPLQLPWEHASRDSLLRAKHQRFRRTKEEDRFVRELLKRELHSQFSERSERRYRHRTASEPHVDGLIHLSLLHMTRYTDLLRAGGYRFSDQTRYSLESLLAAKTLAELKAPERHASLPTPSSVWEAMRNEYVEWPAPLSMKFPHLSDFGNRMIRFADGAAVAGIDPPIAPGSWALLEKTDSVPDVSSDRKKHGWSRPIYVLRRGVKFFCGYLEREENRFVLNGGASGSDVQITFRVEDLPQLSRVAGVAVPV